jgi:hypothetical protein
MSKFKFYIYNKQIFRIKETPVENRLGTHDRLVGMLSLILEVSCFQLKRLVRF